MQRIVLINGPAGVGKSTVGELLARSCRSSVVISGDCLNGFIVNRSGAEKGRLGYKNGAALIENFIQAGYEMVIFEYVFPSEIQLNYLRNEIKVKVPATSFTLWAKLNVLQNRAKKRHLRVIPESEITSCYEELKQGLDQFENKIQTDNFTPAEIVARIRKRLNI